MFFWSVEIQRICKELTLVVGKERARYSHRLRMSEYFENVLPVNTASFWHLAQVLRQWWWQKEPQPLDRKLYAGASTALERRVR